MAYGQNEIPSYGEPSLQSQALIETAQRCFVPNYKQKEVILERGEGARIWDSDGNAYIDLGTGISVTSLGHGDPELVEALLEQGRKLWHASNIYYNEPSIKLAQELLAKAPFAERVFFCNSGGEANEAAIKLARKFSSLHFGPDKRGIVTFEGGFHGRTLATVTATPQPKYHAGFEPLPGGFSYCPFNDFDAAEAAINDQTCAVLVEPIQGEGGIRPAAEGFLQHLRKLCTQHNALLMCDEIQTGMGRTGQLFTHQWEPELRPDVVTMAKALGGGLPIAAVLVGAQAAETLQPGSHGTTFGGNPVACAAARVMWRRVSQSELLAHVRRQGEALMAELERLNQELDLFSEIRGRGLMIGAQLKGDWIGRAGELTDSCQHHGALVLIAGNNDVLRFLPPLIISDAELQTGMSRVAAALRASVNAA